MYDRPDAQTNIFGSTLYHEKKRVSKLEHRCSELFYWVSEYEKKIRYLLEEIADMEAKHSSEMKGLRNEKRRMRKRMQEMRDGLASQQAEIKTLQCENRR